MNLMNILLGLTLGTFIMTATFQWHAIIKHSWEKIQKRKIDLDIQKIIFQYLYRDIQKGGYKGPRTNDKSYPFYTHYCQYTPEYRYFRFNQTLFGFFGSPGHCFGKMPHTACERLALNTDVLIIFNIPHVSTPLLRSMIDRSEPLVISNPLYFQENSLMLIADHEQADVFILTNIEKNHFHHKKVLGKNESAMLSKPYAIPSEVVELQTVAYYLGIPERTKKNTEIHQENLNEKTVYSLYRDDFLHPAQELVSGLVALNFTYGIINQKKEIQYVNANEIKHWNQVNCVKIEIETKTGNKWHAIVTWVKS